MDIALTETIIAAVSRAVPPPDALDPDCSQRLDLVRGGRGLGEMRLHCLPLHKVRGLCEAFESLNALLGSNLSVIQHSVSMIIIYPTLNSPYNKMWCVLPSRFSSLNGKYFIAPVVALTFFWNVPRWDVETVSVKIQVVSRFFELTSCTREVNVTTTIADNGSHPVQYLVLQTINITEVYCQCHFVFYGHNVFVYFTKVTYFSRKDLKLI